MNKEDTLHILEVMKKSYLALGICDTEAVKALSVAIDAVQTDYSVKMALQYAQGYNDGFIDGMMF